MEDILDMELVLVRHGETRYNRADLFRGRADLPLNGQGLMQARAAGKALSRLTFEGFYSSPLLRAMQTAREIARFHQMTVQPLGYFIDVDYGEWSGKTVEEVRRNWPREFELWVKRPGELVFPGGESLKEVCQRVNEGLLWLRDHHQQRVLLVGHKLVNRIILCIVLGLSLEGIWSIDQSNGAINVITTFDERWMIRRMNDVSHIESCLSREQLT